MKYIKLLLVVLIFAAFVPVAFSQDSVITLKHDEIGNHQRPIVDFDHDMHSSKIDCLQCHHDFDAYMNNRGGDGQTCTTCHDGKDAGRELVSLKDAFHSNCKGCHQNMLDLGKPSGPITCGGCHVKK